MTGEDLGGQFQLVPQHREAPAYRIPDAGGDSNQEQGDAWIESFDYVNGSYEVNPENEIDQWLRPAHRDQNRPHQMPAAEQDCDNQGRSVRMYRHHFVFPLLVAARLPALPVAGAIRCRPLAPNRGSDTK